MLLAVLVLAGGRVIRQTMLVGPEGRWKDQLWLDDLIVAPMDAPTAEEETRPVLTSPLPINYCSVDSLTLLPGVGPVLAGRIDEHRRAGVVFRTLEELRSVKGIGPALSARLESLIVFIEVKDPTESTLPGIPPFPAPVETPASAPLILQES